MVDSVARGAILIPEMRKDDFEISHLLFAERTKTMGEKLKVLAIK